MQIEHILSLKTDWLFTNIKVTQYVNILLTECCILPLSHLPIHLIISSHEVEVTTSLSIISPDIIINRGNIILGSRSEIFEKTIYFNFFSFTVFDKSFLFQYNTMLGHGLAGVFMYQRVRHGGTSRTNVKVPTPPPGLQPNHPAPSVHQMTVAAPVIQQMSVPAPLDHQVSTPAP